MVELHTPSLASTRRSLVVMVVQWSVALRVSVQASPTDRASWLRLAAEVEEAGFDGLFVADHPGSGPAPFVALAAAAGATERIRVGTYVLNAGVGSQ